jgi:hypothetical protein
MPEAVDMPQHVETVFAVVGANPLRNAIGAVFLGHDGLRINPWPLIVLDWSLAQFDELAEWVAATSARVRELTRMCGALKPSDMIWIEPGGVGESILPAFYDVDHEEVDYVPEELAALTLQERAVAASLYVRGGQVMLTKTAYAKETTFEGVTRNHLLAQMKSFGMTSEEPEATELFMAWYTGILLSLRPA